MDQKKDTTEHGTHVEQMFLKQEKGEVPDRNAEGSSGRNEKSHKEGVCERVTEEFGDGGFTAQDGWRDIGRK